MKKTVRIGLNDVIYFLLLCMMMLEGYFKTIGSDFLWAKPIWNACILAVFVLVLLEDLYMHRFDKQLFNTLLVGVPILVLFMVVSYFTGEDQGYAAGNLRTLMGTTVRWASVALFIKNPGAHFFARVKRSFRLFNFFGILNMIVLSVQVTGTPFMIRPVWLQLNSFYLDHCAGLFGVNGTPRLSIYMTFLTIYDLYIAEFEIKDRRKKKTLYVYLFVLLLWCSVLTTINSCRAFYAVLVLNLIAYVYLDMHWRGLRVPAIIVKAAKYIFVGLVAVVLLFCIPGVRDTLIEIVSDVYIKLFTTRYTSNVSDYGGAERLRIVLVSFEQGFGYKFGRGMGYYLLSGSAEDNVRVTGFNRYGINSMGSWIYVMGVWFYLFYIVWITSMIRISRDRALSLVIAMLLVLFTFFEAVISNMQLIVTFTFLFSVFSMMKEKMQPAKARGRTPAANVYRHVRNF